MSNQTSLEVLGLFPTFKAGSIGGVQESARIAWEAISRHASAQRGQATLFCYGSKSAELYSASDFSFASKPATVLMALRHEWRAQVVVIWHAGLLKLLPFFRLAGAKVVLFLHGIEVWRKLDWLSRKQLQRVSLFLCNSDHTWNRFLTFNPELSGHNRQTVALGMLTPSSQPAQAPSAPPAVLMLGRLSRSEDYKGHREVIAAWPLVQAQYPDAELWIVGDGELRADLEQAAIAHGLGASVRFWGYLPEERKQELLMRCRCLALPSRGEGFGLVYLEAMRLGRPCLVSTLDAGREVVNPPDAGLAVNPAETAEVAAALGRLLADTPEWHDWSEQAVRRYENAYTARHFQERLVNALFDGRRGFGLDV